jgi:hypothetical protein
LLGSRGPVYHVYQITSHESSSLESNRIQIDTWLEAQPPVLQNITQYGLTLALVGGVHLQLMREESTHTVGNLVDLVCCRNKDPCIVEHLLHRRLDSVCGQCLNVLDKQAAAVRAAAHSPLSAGAKEAFRLHIASAATTLAQYIVSVDGECVKTNVRACRSRQRRLSNVSVGGSQEDSDRRHLEMNRPLACCSSQ